MKAPGIVGCWLCLLLFSYSAQAAPVTLMRPAHALPAGLTQESWLQLDVFDQGFDILGYSNKLGASARPDHMQILRLGSDYRLPDHCLLRGELMTGEQTIVRSREPKQLNPSFAAWQLMLQWQPADAAWRLEAGVQQHRIGDQGFSIYQTATTTVIAAPGKQLASSSASDRGWFVRAAIPYVRGNWHIRAVAGFQRNRVQARYVIDDPAIRPLVAKSIPQAAPWQENQLALLLGADVPLSAAWTLGMDVRHVSIKRAGYQPASNGQEFNTSDSLDGWLSWQQGHGLALTLHGHANSRFMLGDMPAFYNRGVSNKFRYPFAWLSLNLSYRH